MDQSKAFTVKQNQVGDDSGYSCTSTQSKYSIKSCHSQSASSGDSCFEERRSPKTTNDGNSSILNSTSPKQPNQIITRDDPGLKTITNLESSNTSSKFEQINVITFEPQRDQLFSIDVSDLKRPSSALKMEIDESNNLDEDTKEDRDQSNTAFLQLANLCQSYHDFLNVKNINSNLSDESTCTDLKELNEQEIQLKEINISKEICEDSFDVIVSMNDGLIINTSNSIHKNMGYPKDFWQGRSFIDFIYPQDRASFTSYVTSVLTNPSTVSKQDGTSNVTFLQSKNNDGFYCNMRRYRGLNTGFSIDQKQNHYQVCKLTITFKDSIHASTSSCLKTDDESPRSQLLLIIKAHLIYSAYTCPKEKKENAEIIITKHNALFEWCYVDHLVISHFGYLPQNIIGKSIFAYYNSDDLTTNKEIHENMITPQCAPYKGNPYRFKCQNGDFALVQTEWSNFVNPWTGRVEFVIGKHKVIQGPTNPDITTPVDDIWSEEKVTEDTSETYEDIKRILNKNVHSSVDVLHQINQTLGLNTNVKQHKSKKGSGLELYTNNCFVEDLSVQVPLEVKVQPEMCGSFSNHDSVILGDISPHHNYESKSSSETPPSYTQLNYNDNILRFFNSNLHTNSSEDLSEQSYPKEIIGEKITPFDTDVDRVQPDTISSQLQNATSSSSINTNHMSTNYPEHNLNQNSQQPLTQKMLLRHNKKMEDDLVKQHKHNTKRIKSSEKQQHIPEETKDMSDITHGIKRNNSSQCEVNPCKLSKRDHIPNNNSNNIFTQTQENENIATCNSGNARSTQIWPPCKITRDSQTTVDLPCQVHCYNVPLTNNVMPIKNNEYPNMFTLMDPSGQNKELLSTHLHPLPVPLYTTIPVMNHIPRSSQFLQPCSLHYNNQLLLQPYDNNIQCEKKIDQPNETPDLISSRINFHQETKALQVNQEEVITSSDSEYKRENKSFKSSSGWMYEYSSFYSSSLRDSSSDKEDHSTPSDFNKPNPHYFIKKQPIENDIKTPDLVFRYQMVHGDIHEVLQKDMKALNTLPQPLLVNEQLKQLCVELDVNSTSKTSYFEDETSSSGGDECLISFGKNKKRKIDFSRMAMIYEENAPLPPPTTSHEMSSNTQSTA